MNEATTEDNVCNVCDGQDATPVNVTPGSVLGGAGVAGLNLDNITSHAAELRKHLPVLAEHAPNVMLRVLDELAAVEQRLAATLALARNAFLRHAATGGGQPQAQAQAQG